MTRDLKADLELCNKATKGPWKVKKIKDGIYIGSETKPVAHMCDLYGKESEANTEFIAQAREGWQYAIKRAIKAENLNDMLVEYNKFLAIEVLQESGRADKAEVLVQELISSMKESIEWCETCRDEYSYTKVPSRDRLCARCQTFNLHIDKVARIKKGEDHD